VTVFSTFLEVLFLVPEPHVFPGSWHNLGVIFLYLSRLWA